MERKSAETSSPDAIPAKSKRVRTGCLTCRERHLKCDEETPHCRNCRKGKRECKRGIKLNFIDLVCKGPPYIPYTDEWTVKFEDESRDVASQYEGGLGRYTRLDAQLPTSPQEAYAGPSPQSGPQAMKRTASQATAEPSSSMSTCEPRGAYYEERCKTHPELVLDAQLHSRGNSGASYRYSASASSSTLHRDIKSEVLTPPEEMDTKFHSPLDYRSSDMSAAATVAGSTIAGPPSTIRGIAPGNVDVGGDSKDSIMARLDKGDREFINSPEELYFMQVFVTEVALWMDSLDRDKHFSRLIPFWALKCPMLLNALLACGVKHLTQTQQYSDAKALLYYDTATTQLLRNLQNPDRKTVECALTAVVLNVYEIMSEKPAERMSHIAGARALIRECGWDAKAGGLGAACFWLNIGMELLSCLAFNWKTSWAPETWGLNMDFTTERDVGCEEIWVHRLFYIVAKIADFRATIPKFQKPNPHDEQLRVQRRMSEWNDLKRMCAAWDDACPRPMHPFGYIGPTTQTGPTKSLFPNIWLLKRAAVVGRLYYHMALCILAQVNPSAPKISEEQRTAQLHHAHQVCGIVAHNKDRGVASVSIRSLVIVSEVLTDYAEQQEVITILERIERETGWKLAGIVTGLKRRWGWEQPDPSGRLLAPPGSGTRPGNENPMGNQPADRIVTWQPLSSTTNVNTALQQMMLAPVSQVPITVAPQQMQPVMTPSRPMRVNPLDFADFSRPNHPYKNWYEPPNRSNPYNSQGLR